MIRHVLLAPPHRLARHRTLCHVNQTRMLVLFRPRVTFSSVCGRMDGTIAISLLRFLFLIQCSGDYTNVPANCANAALVVVGQLIPSSPGVTCVFSVQRVHDRDWQKHEPIAEKILLSLCSRNCCIDLSLAMDKVKHLILAL